MTNARRCAKCDVHWPHAWKYFQECPQCQAITTAVTVDVESILSMEAACSIINHLNFDRHVEGRKLLPVPDAAQTQKDAQRKSEERIARSARFPGVIQGAGFNAIERTNIANLEARLACLRDPHEDDQIESD